MVESGASRRSPQPPGQCSTTAAIHLSSRGPVSQNGDDIVAANHPDSRADLQRLIDIPTLARCLGTSIRHVRRLVAERRIQYIKVRHLVRFDPDEIRTWLREHAHEVSA
jgi:excisionase family DNA binding protein